jgi:hypothetical protein
MYIGGQTQMMVKMVVRPIAKLSEELDHMRAVHRQGLIDAGANGWRDNRSVAGRTSE